MLLKVGWSAAHVNLTLQSQLLSPLSSIDGVLGRWCFRGETGPPVNLAEEQESLLGDMQRWYSEGHHDPRRAGSDVHVLPDQ